MGVAGRRGRMSTYMYIHIHMLHSVCGQQVWHGRGPDPYSLSEQSRYQCHQRTCVSDTHSFM
jgi:hypothetical protein